MLYVCACAIDKKAANLCPKRPVEQTVLGLERGPFDEDVDGPEDAEHTDQIEQQIAQQLLAFGSAHLQLFPLRKERRCVERKDAAMSEKMQR